jgi:hypothetical protein
MPVTLLVSTCLEYFDKTIPKLIKNLEEIGYPKNEVLIVSGGEDKEDKIDYEGVQVVKVPWRCFEFTSLIYVSELSDDNLSDYYFLIHDNVKLEKNFYTNIKIYCQKISENNLLGAKLQMHDPSMNMGIYSKRMFQMFRLNIALFKFYSNNLDFLKFLKKELINYEDIYFRTLNLPALVDDTVDKEVSILKTDNNRIYKVSKYNKLGFTKIQQNFSVDMCEVNIPEIIISESK